MAEAVAAGNKAAAEEIEGKHAGAVKKTKKVMVQVKQQYIDALLARPPRWTPRPPIVFQHPAESQDELEFREALLELEASLKDSKNEYDKDMAILEEYCDEVVMTEGN